MADGFVQLQPDSTGTKVDGDLITVGANSVLRQRTQIAGLAATDIAKVTAANGLEVNVTKLPVGPAAPSASTPVNLSNDVVVGAAASIAAINVDLLTNVVSGWYDAANFHSVAIQIIGSTGITAGAIFFECTNDTTAASAGNIWQVEEVTTLTPTPNIAAITIAASTTRLFAAPVTTRYVRVRVSTAFAGANVQAVAVFSQLPYFRMVNTVHQATAGNLNVTATVSGSLTSAGTVSTVTAVTSANLGIPTLVADVASAALTTTTTTAAFTPTFGTTYEVNIPVTVVSGTTPTLDVVVQESDDTGTNWFDVYHFPRITVTGMYRSPKLALTGNRVRYVQTVGGTTPSFTRAVNRLQTSDFVDYVRQFIDRTLAASQALNAVTGSINTQNCRNLQLIISAAAATTPPALQLEGSADFGATWYSIGTPLTAVASSVVQATVSSFNAALVRARVSTAGVSATLNYVIIKGF